MLIESAGVHLTNGRKMYKYGLMSDVGEKRVDEDYLNNSPVDSLPVHCTHQIGNVCCNRVTGSCGLV